MEPETPDQEMARIWGRIQELRKEYIHEMELDVIESSERMDQIIARIRGLEARYRELGGILYGSAAGDDEDESISPPPTLS